MKKYFFKLFLSLIVLQSCSEKSNNSSTLQIIDIDLSNAIDKLNFSDIIEKDIEVVRLETNEDCLIGEINKILTTKDYIFVLDVFSTESLFMFNKSGKFVRKIGIKGGGPKEYTKPLDFIIEEDKITILDNGYTIVSYNFNGDFISKNKLKDFSAFKLLKISEENTAFISGGRLDNLTISDKKYNVVDSYFPYISRAVNTLEINPLFNSNGKSFYRRYLNDTLYSISKGGAISPSLIFNYVDKRFDVNKYIDLKDIDRKIDIDIYDYCITTHYYENSDFRYLVFSYNDVQWIYLKKKKSNHYKLLKMNSLINDVTYEDYSYVTAVEKDKFIYLVEPQDLINGLEMNSSNSKNGFYKKMLSISEKIDFEDNPILVFVKFKIDEE